MSPAGIKLPAGCAAATLTVGYPDNEHWPKGTVVEIMEHPVEHWCGAIEVWHVKHAHPGTVDFDRLRPLTQLASELLDLALVRR